MKPMKYFVYDEQDIVAMFIFASDAFAFMRTIKHVAPTYKLWDNVDKTYLEV